MEKNRFGKLLKQLRKAKGFHQKQLVDTLGCTLQNVSNWESGRYLPSEKSLRRIIEVFGLKRQRNRKQALGLIFEYAVEKDLHTRKRIGLTTSERVALERGGQVPLLNSRDFQINPVDISFRGKWRGPRTKNLPGLSPIDTFAYVLEDKSVAPILLPGDILFCSGLSSILTHSREKSVLPGKLGSLVLASVGKKVVCGILRKGGDLMLNWGSLKKGRRRTVSKNSVQWACSVLAKVTNLRSVSFDRLITQIR